MMGKERTVSWEKKWWQAVTENSNIIEDALDNSGEISILLNDEGTRRLTTEWFQHDTGRDFYVCVLAIRSDGQKDARQTINFKADAFTTLLENKDNINNALIKFKRNKRPAPGVPSVNDEMVMYRYVTGKDTAQKVTGDRLFFSVTDALDDGLFALSNGEISGPISTESLLKPAWPLSDMVRKAFFFWAMLQMKTPEMCQACVDAKARSTVPTTYNLDDHTCVHVPTDNIEDVVTVEKLEEIHKKRDVPSLTYLITNLRSMIGCKPTHAHVYAEFLVDFVTGGVARAIVPDMIRFLARSSPEVLALQRAMLKGMSENLMKRYKSNNGAGWS